jgi:hypothetical protein
MPRHFQSIIRATAFALLICLVCTSCRRTDYQHFSSASSLDAIRARFFSSLSQDVRVNAIKQKIFREEQTSSFVQGYSRGAGFPHWDKALVAGGQHAALRGESGGSDYTVIYIPFTKDSNNVIGAILMAVVTPRDTLFKTMYRWQYNQLPHKTASSSGPTAEQMALFFMGFEHQAFGHAWFHIADTSLFHFEFPVGRPLLYQADNLTIGRDGISLQLCGWVYQPASGWNQGLDPGEEPDYGSEVYKCEDISTGGDGDNPFVGGGGGGTGFPGTVGSGTGGGGGGWNDNPCRSIGAAGGGNPCDGGTGTSPGWQPFIVDEDAPPIIGWTNNVPILEGGIVAQYYNTNETFWHNVSIAAASATPFSTQGLRNLCSNRGWDANVAPVVFNRKVGKAFEETALKFYNFTENKINYSAPQRALRNAPDPPTKVRPDALDSYHVMWWDQQGASHQANLERTFGVEVKAYAGTLELSSNSWQILGELEILRKNFDDQVNSPYWQQLDPPITIDNSKYAPCLFFITTDDTQIGQSIINKAAELGISVWQAKARWDATNSKVTFDMIKFVYDKSGRFPAGEPVPRTLFETIVQGAFNIGVPMQLELFPDTNFDLDPEEVN